MPCFPHYQQLDHKDCGPTCLKIVARHYGKVISLPKIRLLTQTSPRGSRLLGLCDAAEKMGFKATGVRINFLTLSKEVALPFMCMRMVALIISLTFMSFQTSKGQHITGKVIDSETDSVITSANIYFNNSFNGTTSDLDGNFNLDISQNYGQNIVVSCVGYETETIENYVAGNFYLVYLMPKSILLTELVIESDEIPRKKKLKIFLKEFLGSSANAKKCTIKNLDDLRLIYFKSTSTLEAYCKKPLIIHNKALGYQITYFLREFKNRYRHTYYEGSYFFEEDTTLTEKAKLRVVKSRETAYYGSRMHFFRILWKENLSATKFLVKNRENGKKLSAQDLIVSQKGNEKHLSSKAPLSIIYGHELSYITFKTEDDVLFTKSGFFAPKGLSWEGQMTQQRISDLLPFEYCPFQR